jgi:hypothetical protein
MDRKFLQGGYDVLGAFVVLPVDLDDRRFDADCVIFYRPGPADKGAESCSKGRED